MVAAKLGHGAAVEAWQVALGAVFISGAAFMLLSFTGLVDHIIVMTRGGPNKVSGLWS